MTEIQFINMSHPSHAGSAESLKRAHSRAARTAHAKARRLRMEQYQAQHDGSRWKRRDTEGVPEDPPEGTTKQRRASRTLAPTAEVGRSPGPMSVLDPFREDPFASSERHMNRTERFLMDYCKFTPWIRPYLAMIDLPTD